MNSDTPPGNFKMLSWLDELELRGLFLTEQKTRSGQHSVKKVYTRPACLAMRVFQSCQGGVTIRGSLGYPHSSPPPPGLIHVLEINNIHKLSLHCNIEVYYFTNILLALFSFIML